MLGYQRTGRRLAHPQPHRYPDGQVWAWPADPAPAPGRPAPPPPSRRTGADLEHAA